MYGSRAILWGARMMCGRKNQVTDGSVLQLERNKNSNRGQRRVNGGESKKKKKTTL